MVISTSTGPLARKEAANAPPLFVGDSPRNPSCDRCSRSDARLDASASSRRFVQSLQLEGGYIGGGWFCDLDAGSTNRCIRPARSSAAWSSHALPSIGDRFGGVRRCLCRLSG